MRWIRNVSALVVGASLATYWAWNQALNTLDSKLIAPLTDAQRRAHLAETPPSIWQEGDTVRHKDCEGESSMCLVTFIDLSAGGGLFLGEVRDGDKSIFLYFNVDEFVLYELNEETRGVI